MNKQPEVVEQITKYLSHFPNVERIILFGSRARGDERERSDIDIAIVGPDITRAEWRSMRDYVEEEARTLLSIDLLRFESAPERVKESITREGVVLYERHPTKTVR